MPFTVITLSKVPASLRGDLSKWMQEIATGVYIGNFNSRVREHLWQRVTSNIGQGQATISYQAQTELGYDFATFNTERFPVDYDGLHLVMIPTTNDLSDELKPGFSKASNFHKAHKFSHSKFTERDDKAPESDAALSVATDVMTSEDRKISYVVLDLETDGLDPFHDNIIEIGALKFISSEPEIFQRLISHESPLRKDIISLTNITDDLLRVNGVSIEQAMAELLDFIGGLPIVGYGVDFDINFINAYLGRQGLPGLNNKCVDVLQLVKREKMFLPNYKLSTVLSAYGIESSVQHRALEDARLTSELAVKVNKFYDYLKIKAGK